MTYNLSVTTFYQSLFTDPFNRVKEIGLESLNKTKSIFSASADKFAEFHSVVGLNIITRIFTKRTNTWTDFVPTALILGLGALTIPSFKIGMLSAVIESGAAISVRRMADKSSAKSNYDQEIESVHPFHISVTVPVIEELEFRGIYQNLMFLAGGSTPSILFSGILFGMVHLGNDHDKAKFQAIINVIIGFLLGALNNNYGILASLSYHIMRNFLILFASQILFKTN